MIRLIEGGFYTLPEEEVKEEILRKLREAEGGREIKYRLVVPEGQTVATEEEMARRLPPSSPLVFEVTNFTRLCDTVFRRAGGVGTRRADRARCALIMWQTLAELLPHLSTMGKEVSPGTVRKALDAVAQVQAIGLTPEELAQVAESDAVDGDMRLRAKLSDMAKISSAYRTMMGDGFADGGEILPRATAKVCENPLLFSGCRFYFCGFTSFTADQYAMLSALAGRAEVTVTLCLPKVGRDSFEYTEPADTRARLIRIAQKSGVDISARKIDGVRGTKSENLPGILRLLWKNGGTLEDYREGYPEEVRLLLSDTPYEECDFVAEDILRRVQSGASYSDFAVTARDLTSLGGALSDAFSKAGVPLFISERRDVSTFEAVKLIYAAYAAVSGWSARDVISYIKCPLSGVSRTECDEFEGYVSKWQITGRRFTDGIYWSMNPDGYTTKRREGCDELLRRVNATRDKIVGDLSAFAEDIAGNGHTVREHATALVSLLCRLGVREGLTERAQELLTLGEERSARESLSVWELITGALDSAVSVMGEATVSADSFSAILRTLFELCDAGAIPEYRDAVSAAPADMLRARGKKHVYLLSVNEGEFPRAADDGGYFSDAERERLFSLGYDAPPELPLRSARELFIFSRAIASATETVTLVSTQRTGALRRAGAARVIDRIIEISGGVLRQESISAIPEAERAYSAELTLERVAEHECEVRDVLTSVGLGERLAVAEGETENRDLRLTAARDALYDGGIALTQSRIERFTSCPLAYFLEYNMKLSDSSDARFDKANIGSFVHMVMERTVKRIGELRRAGGVMSDCELEASVRSTAREYVESVYSGERGGRMDNMIRRLCRAAVPAVRVLRDEFSEGSEFLPVFFELPISEKGGREAAKAPEYRLDDGTRVRIYGTVDRVDSYSDGQDAYIRVTDYKTGERDIKKSDIDEGKNLQMLLYMKAVSETDDPDFCAALGAAPGGRLIPAGIIYAKAGIDDPVTDSEDGSLASAEKEQRRGGLLTANKAITDRMNQKYIPLSFNKDGSLRASSQSRVFTEEEYRELDRKTGDAVLYVAREMKNGNISSRPLYGAAHDAKCGYCRFKSFCRGGFDDRKK